MRVRGLKQKIWYVKEKYKMSHPVRVRGLKPDIVQYDWIKENVAPRAGAWIETPYYLH